MIVMIAGGQRFDFAGRRVDALQIGAALFGDIDEDAAAVAAPERLAARCRRAAVPGRRRCRRQYRNHNRRSDSSAPRRPRAADEQVRLAVRTLRKAAASIDRAHERDASAIRAERELADRAIDACDLGNLAA